MSAIQHPARAGVVDALVHNPLLIPGKRPVYNSFMIGGGQQLLIGSVLGKITATGALVLCAAAAGDGSQNPFAVCPENIFTFDEAGEPEAKFTSVIVEGFFNSTALRFGAGYTFAALRDAMAARGLHARAPGFSG